ncbi:MAG: hypothetical protein PVH19_06875 [Planctomycetia bacterium]
MTSQMMTPRERLLRTLQGQPVDRVPIYTQIPFAITDDGFRPGPFHGYEDYDDWREQDPRYVELVRRMEEECDNLFIWRSPCMLSTPSSCHSMKLGHFRRSSERTERSSRSKR